MDQIHTYHYAKKMVDYYIDQLPVKNEYLHMRTSNMFISIIFDEVTLFFKSKCQSSLKSNTEYGVCRLVCDIFTNFIQPMYDSLFNHKSYEYDTEMDNIMKTNKNTKAKSVKFDTNKNTILRIEALDSK
jgi:hypothetical protein